MERKEVKYSAKRAFDRMARYCSMAERAESDVVRLTRGYGLDQKEIEEVVARLKELGFLNQERYVSSFVRSKERAGWGRYKIASALRAKGVAGGDIERGLEILSDGDEMITELVQKKMRTTKYKDIYDLKGKLMRYGLGRGFDLDVCKGVVERVVRDVEDEID